MSQVAFGTAQLFGLADQTRSEQLLDEAWRVGFRRFDTAPSYGGGRSEAHLGTFLAGRDGLESITTKVGLAPALGTRRGRRGLVAVAKAVLPAPVTGVLRRSAHAASRGRFSPPEVTGSVTESLRRLGGRIDRLVLHEIRPDEVTDELLETLDAYVRDGDVGQIGVATQNSLTSAALAAGRGMLTVAHFGVGPLDAPVVLPGEVTVRVGHGLLGGGGDHLRRLEAVLAADPDLTDQWRAATSGTEFGHSGGLADVLLARGPHLDVTDVLVASTRVEHVRRVHELASRTAPLPVGILTALTALIHQARVRAGHASRTGSRLTFEE